MNGETHPELLAHIEWELAHSRIPQLELCTIADDFSYWRVKPLETMQFESWLRTLREENMRGHTISSIIASIYDWYSLSEPQAQGSLQEL